MYYVMGVDLGTTNIKAALFDEEGKLVADAFSEVPLYQPRPGWAEQDLNEILNIATDCMKKCLEKASVDPKRIVAVAFDGQMSGLGAVDRHLEPVMPFDSWLDTRCSPYIEKMYKYVDLVIRKAGGPPTYSHGPKILRWKEEMPSLFEKMEKFVVPAVYVASKLGNLQVKDVFIDYTYIHFSNLCDIEKNTWDEDLCRLFGIPTEKLPRIVRPWDVVGRISKEASESTGLLEGTPIVAGCGDQAAAMLGAGVVDPFVLFDSAGTASVLAITVDEYKPDTRYRTLFMAHTVFPDIWYAIAFINGGGQNLRWFRDEFASPERDVARLMGVDPYEVLNEEAKRVPAGADGVVFIPHLGGRVCPSQPHLRGVWFGFNWGHSRAHFYRSILEGIAYEYGFYLDVIREMFPEVSFKHAVVVGGGSRSELWNGIKASVLELPYYRVNRTEGAVFGSAVLAGFGVGLFKDLRETIRKSVSFTSLTEPCEEWMRIYSKYKGFYRELLEKVNEMFQRFFKEAIE